MVGSMFAQMGFDFGDGTPVNTVELKRDFHGYAQYREDEYSPWQFYVCGFDSTCSGEAGRCAILKNDGTEEDVPIDAEDQITVRGKKYDRRYWNH